MNTPQAPHTTEAHTPTPWILGKRASDEGYWNIFGVLLPDRTHEYLVARVIDANDKPQNDANAAHIVHCVNSFDALTEANARLSADAERYRRIRYCRKFVGMLETATMHCDTDAEYDEAVDRMPKVPK